jgi:hypothetical protein
MTWKDGQIYKGTKKIKNILSMKTIILERKLKVLQILQILIFYFINVFVAKLGTFLSGKRERERRGGRGRGGGGSCKQLIIFYFNVISWGF